VSSLSGSVGKMPSLRVQQHPCTVQGCFSERVVACRERATADHLPPVQQP